MNKKIVCLLVLALLAVAAFAEMAPKDRRNLPHFHNHHHHHHHHDHHHDEKEHHPDFVKFSKMMRAEHPDNAYIQQAKQRFHKFGGDKNKFAEKPFPMMKKGKKDFDFGDVMTTLNPGQTYVKSIDYAGMFSVPFFKGDAIAVQIVRTSDKYSFEKSPVLRRCVSKRGHFCESDKDNKSLSFELSADELRKHWHDTLDFTIFTVGMETGVNVGFYVCVGENATLENCKAPATRNCEHGTPSDVMDACVCYANYTGLDCDESMGEAPNVFSDFDYDVDIILDFVDGIICIISFIAFFIFFLIVLTLIAGCCACLRACCRQHCSRRGSVVNRNLPPPPAYQYHPLSTVPPPPPPPQMGQCYDVHTGNAIEMSTLPVARNANPVYIMPPLAPVKQVPVFVQPPPAPKN